MKGPQERAHDRATYTVTEAARVLGIGRNTAYELAHSGRLRAIWVGRRILIPKQSVEAFLDSA